MPGAFLEQTWSQKAIQISRIPWQQKYGFLIQSIDQLKPPD